MKKALLPLALLSIVTICVLSCNKPASPGPVTGSASPLTQVFAALRSIPQSFSVTPGKDTIVYGAGGTVLHFYVNSFTDNRGYVITGGTVYLQLVEVYGPGEMIANRAGTVAGDSLLTSGGEINLTATATGITLYINKYGIGFKQAAASAQQMQLYYGINTTPDSVTTWAVGKNITPGTTAAGTKEDTITLASSFYFFDSCSGMGLVNCDYFWGGSHTGSQLTDITVTMPDASYNSNNTEVFLAFPADKVLIPISKYNDTTYSFSLNYHGTQLPVGLNYQLVAITNNNGNWYYYETSGTTTNGLIINAAMVPEAKEDIITQLAGL